MPKPPLDPDVDALAPSEDGLTPYDDIHLITYLRLLDADAEGADWREVAWIVLHFDPDRDFNYARRAYESRLARANWIAADRPAGHLPASARWGLVASYCPGPRRPRRWCASFPAAA
jgi:hypothetical protein